MFVKNIINNRITIESLLKISLFRPRGLKTLLDSISDDKYILGVGYPEGDHQICISGRKKKSEDVSDAVYREISEELGIWPAKPPTMVLQKGNNHFYKLNIKDTVFIPYTLKNTDFDTKDRIVCCVYGDERDILDYLENVKLSPDNEDAIVSIWSDKISNIRDLVIV